MFSVFVLLISCNKINKEQDDLLTVAERTNYTSTSTYSDVISFISRLKQLYPSVWTETIAVSTEGKEIPLMILGTINKNNPVVYIQANIHAGEVEGKEATLMLARDMLKYDPDGLLDKVTLLICPIFNPDGNDKISKKNQTNQNGPFNGVGVRYNGQHLDINRDALKLETPEMRGLVQNVLNRWEPDVTVDCHTTNGSYHEEPVTFSWGINPNGDKEIINYMRDKMMPAVGKELEKKYNVPNCYYGVFIDREDHSKGWLNYASEPRYMFDYVGVRNRLSILNENYVYADFKTRVNGCYHFLKSVIEYTVKNGKDIRELVKKADEAMVNRFAKAERDSFAIEYKVKPTPEKMKIVAYEVDVETDVNGRKHYKKSNRKEELLVDYLADYFPVKSVAVPRAYILTVNDRKIINNLKMHGIKTTQLEKDTTLTVETFRIDSLKPSPRLNQGHFQNFVYGKYITVEKEFKAGDTVIRTDQPLGNVVCYLLEPQTDDGLLRWNFFDRYLQPQWGRGFYPYPVYRLM